MANCLKFILHEIIYNDQTGFLKGRNIGCNVRSIIDLVDIPGSIVLLDIEKRLILCQLDYLSNNWSNVENIIV